MGGLSSLARAAVGAIPLIPRGDRPPDRTLNVAEVRIDRANVAAYAALTGLRYGDRVPLTYPFVLSFPTVMTMLTAFDFPFPAMGAVHVANEITTLRPVAVTDTLGITVRAGNLREHRKGLLVDLLTEVWVGNEPAWQQVSTFLHQQRTSLSDQPKPAPPKASKLPPPNAILTVTPSVIRRYASVSGDRNPIHTSALGARLFGFPGVIAHGMYSAAAVLANIEGKLADRVRYSVKFGKPIVLPARAGVYLSRQPGGWDIALRHPTKGYPHLTATVRDLDGEPGS